MAGFVQIIEFTTSRIDDIKAMADDLDRDQNMSLVERATITEDRDRPNTYLNIVEFASYEQAMENSERPETGEFAARMAELCDGPPKFYNLDVITTM